MRTILAKLREFHSGDPGDFLRTEFRQIIRTLDLILSSLAFKENFGGFEWSGNIPAGSQVEIRNLLYPVIPTRRIVLRSKNGHIGDGQDWNREFVYLENLSASEDTVTVVFLP